MPQSETTTNTAHHKKNHPITFLPPPSPLPPWLQSSFHLLASSVTPYELLLTALMPASIVSIPS
jgi:hypothetical protein